MIEFPTNDYLSDLFSDILDTNRIDWSHNSLNQSGHGVWMDSDHHFNFNSIKYFESYLKLTLRDSSKNSLTISNFDEYRNVMMDFINSCSELNEFFDGFKFSIQDSSYNCIFSSGNYFITNPKLIKLFLSSLNLVCFDSNLNSYNIRFFNDFVILRYRGDLHTDIIDFISGHEYLSSRNQLIIKTSFDWCEKN
jgi:hypothetical protein